MAEFTDGTKRHISRVIVLKKEQPLSVSLSDDMFDMVIGRHETNNAGMREFLERHRTLPWIRACTVDALIYCRKRYGNETGQIQDLIGEDTHALQIVSSMEILQGDQETYQEKNNPEIGGNVTIYCLRIFLRHMETFKPSSDPYK